MKDDNILVNIVGVAMLFSLLFILGFTLSGTLLIAGHSFIMYKYNTK